MTPLFSSFVLAFSCAFASIGVTELKTIADALRLPEARLDAPQPFDFTGEVLARNLTTITITDKTGAADLVARNASFAELTRGNVIHATGVMLWSPKGERMFWADSMDCVDRGKKPDPADAAISDIHAGQLDYRLVRITGVISSVVKDEVDTRYCWSTLCTSSGNVFLALYGKWNDPDKIRPFVDAEVSVMGLVSPISGLRQHLGREISVGNEDEIVLLRQPSPDPFAAPELSTANTPHRRRASGVVLAVEPTRFFILTPQQRLIPVIPTPLADQPIPSPNDLITASGFSSRDPYRIQLSDALIRIDGHATNTARVLTRPIRSLFIDEKGRRRIDTHADGRCIAVCGTATITSPAELRISDGEHAITLETATLRMLGIAIPPDGSRVSASGLCNCEFENPPTPTIYPTFKRFTLIPRDRNDLVTLEAPPWWTPFRLTVLVLILAAILLGSTAWNVMLKRKSEKRGRELYAEKIDHALAEQKVEERTRLAVELHDSVSQTLTGVALQLDGGEVETAKAMLASCRGELRRCLWDLRSRTFEEKDMTEAVTRTITPHLNGVEATVRFNVPRERLSESLTHAILRIIRELVVNAIRHGQAKHIKIAGEMHGSTVSFSVADDGCGFVPETAPGPKQGHFGLLGIRERIEDFNGDLQIASVPGKGAKFTVTLTTTDETNEH